MGTVRQTIHRYLTTMKTEIAEELIQDRRFEQKMGCFVTLKIDDNRKSLRGCIGFSEPVYKLSLALTNAAIYAATQDPRFEPVRLSELDRLLVEVSMLTRPEKINVSNPEDIPSKIKVGLDGLIMKWDFGSGLLLPQVATEFNWTAKSFLENLGIKAGAGSNQWLKPNTQIYKFQTKIFEEITPRGNVILS